MSFPGKLLCLCVVVLTDRRLRSYEVQKRRLREPQTRCEVMWRQKAKVGWQRRHREGVVDEQGATENGATQHFEKDRLHQVEVRCRVQPLAADVLLQEERPHL